jgi:hypothetical protein
MNFTLYDTTSNKPINNLKPYLGTVGHEVAIDKGCKTVHEYSSLISERERSKSNVHGLFPNKGSLQSLGTV